MSLEDQVRRQMEQQAAEQQICPVDGEIDAAFGPTSRGGEPAAPAYKGPAMKRPRAKKAFLGGSGRFKTKGTRGDVPLKIPKGGGGKTKGAR